MLPYQKAATPMLVAEEGKPPYVPQTDGIPETGDEEIEWVLPVTPPLLRRGRFRFHGSVSALCRLFDGHPSRRWPFRRVTRCVLGGRISGAFVPRHTRFRPRSLRHCCFSGLRRHELSAVEKEKWLSLFFLALSGRYHRYLNVPAIHTDTFL